LLRKKLLAAWKAARKWEKTKKMNLGGEPKETAVSGENMPADGSDPAQRNEAGISARPRLRPSDQSAGYLSPTGAARVRFVVIFPSVALASSRPCPVFLLTADM
jgi:hypothetical protein